MPCLSEASARRSDDQTHGGGDALTRYEHVDVASARIIAWRWPNSARLAIKLIASGSPSTLLVSKMTCPRRGNEGGGKGEGGSTLLVSRMTSLRLNERRATSRATTWFTVCGHGHWTRFTVGRHGLERSMVCAPTSSSGRSASAAALPSSPTSVCENPCFARRCLHSCTLNSRSCPCQRCCRPRPTAASSVAPRLRGWRSATDAAADAGEPRRPWPSRRRSSRLGGW